MAGMTSPERIGIDHLTLAGVSPPDLIAAAAEAGARNVSLHLKNNTNPLGLPAYSLLDDPPLRRETLRRARELGVAIALVDGFVLFPGQPVEQYRPNFEVAAELGCRNVNSLSFDPDWQRTKDGLARMAELAAEYGATLNIETFRPGVIKSVARALEIIDGAGRPNMKLMLDTMHVTRSGEAESVQSLDPGLIGYVQISDGPVLQPDDAAYQKEALYNRQVPGEGEMPLAAMLRRTPVEVVVSGEVPLTDRRRAGESDAEIARAVVAGIRKVLAAAAEG